MSFVRLNRRPVRTKKISVPKREWVSTVSDLSVHKPTPEEMSRRREMHRSRNKAAAQWEMREKRRKPRTASPPGLDQTRLRLFREVFSDQCQLQDVLARSDRALAVVKDLFGDAPRRQTGFPSVTAAPDCESDTELPVPQKPDPPTQLSLLSQSVMDQQALNEFIDSAEEHGDAQDSISFNSEMRRPKRKTCKAKPPLWTTNQRVQQQNLPQTPSNAADSVDQAALNATVAVQRLKSKQLQPDMDQSTTLVTQILNPEPAPSHSGGKSRRCRSTTGRSPEACGLDGSGFSSHNQSSLELLQDMLSQVETELACLEPQGPLDPSDQHEPQRDRGRGLTGFSVALVGTLGRITSHLRRREEEAQQEAQTRRRMEEQIKEQKDLIDALTAECLSMREDSAALQAGLQKRVAELEQRLDMVILTMGDAQRDLEPQDIAGPCLKPVPDQRDHGEHGLASPAVMLSPPRQRDSKAPPAARGRSLHVEESQTPGSVSTAESDVSSSSSFISLPASILPCPTHLMPQPSQDSVLEQIAELTRQNAAMQAQLGQNRTSPTGASVVREQSIGRNASPPSGHKPTQQCVRVEDSSVRLMEDRLQELNRQSAAARAKLLELIEQQKQTTSQSVSPSISPIPTHSTSPPTVAVRRTPEVCVSVPERGQPSHAKTNYRKSPEADSLQTVAGQRQTINSQVDQLKGEGWFALSAHIR